MNKEGEKGECSAFEATGGRFFCLILARDLESFFCCVPTYLPTRGDSNAQGKSLRGEWTMQSGDSKEFGICPTGPKGAWHLTLPYLPTFVQPQRCLTVIRAAQASPFNSKFFSSSVD